MDVDDMWDDEEDIEQFTIRGLEKLASPAGAPEGWKLVPVVPTDPMCDAAYSDRIVWNSGPRAIYEAMLSAVSTPPVSEDRKDAERFREGWTHACNALCMEIALWIERCPHCGIPAPKAPAMQEDKP